MQGGAPGGWVVGCKLLGTGSGGIVGFWFAHVFWRGKNLNREVSGR